MPSFTPIAGRHRGKVAVVTGAASGIGRAIARRVVAEGGRGGRRRRRRRRLRSLQGNWVTRSTFVGDVTVEADAEALVPLAVDRFGGARRRSTSPAPRGPALIVDLTEEDWDFTVDLCLKGVFLGIKHAARQMIEQGRGGAIVNIASLNSRVPMFFGAAYSAAKAGVVSLGQYAALELGEHGIRVSTVSPGLTATPLVRPMTDVPAVHAAFMDRIPLGRPATARGHRRGGDVPRQRRRGVRLRRQPVRRRRRGSRPATPTCARCSPTSWPTRSDRRPRHDGRQGAHDGPVADAIFEDPRLAAVYDPLDPDRSDLDVRPPWPRSSGRGRCSTSAAAQVRSPAAGPAGHRGHRFDPAAASLDVARGKPGADAVRWVHGVATTLPPLSGRRRVHDGNVAQVFLSDDEWAATLRAARRRYGRAAGSCSRPETRPGEPGRSGHRRSPASWSMCPTSVVVESWEEVTEVSGELVTFRSMTAFHARRPSSSNRVDAALP